MGGGQRYEEQAVWANLRKGGSIHRQKMRVRNRKLEEVAVFYPGNASRLDIALGVHVRKVLGSNLHLEADYQWFLSCSVSPINVGIVP
jgi:hypothetical protein